MTDVSFNILEDVGEKKNAVKGFGKQKEMDGVAVGVGVMFPFYNYAYISMCH